MPRGNWGPRPHDQKRWDYIVREVRSGKTCEEVGKVLGVSKQRVNEIFRRATNGRVNLHKRERPYRRCKWTPEMDALLGTRFDMELARLWGISAKSVKNRRDALGIPLYSPTGVPKKNRVGDVHDRLTIVGWWRPKGNRGPLYWVCQCKCGNTTKILSNAFGRTRSCGCLQKEWLGRLVERRRLQKSLTTPLDESIFRD